MRKLISCFTLTLIAVAFEPCPPEIFARSKTDRKRKVKKPTSNFSASKKFAVAKKFFDEKKYPEALQTLSQLLKKYPDHEASQLLMAKCYYRMEMQREAYTMFARQNPQYFDPETSYEYATTMYKAKQYPQAMYGYSNVPKTHSLYDLSNYFGALSAIKLRKFKKAEEMMERAVVLPDKLAKSKSQYLKHLGELRLLRERQALAKQKKQERDRLRKAKKKSKSKSSKPEKITPKEYVHTGSMNIAKGASLSATSRTQIADFHGFGKSTSERQQSIFSFSQGPMMTFGNGERRTALGLQLRLGVIDEKLSGQERRDFTFNTSNDIVRINATSTKSAYTAGTVYLSPWVDIPISGDLWLAIGTDVDFFYNEFERSQRSGQYSFFTRLQGVYKETRWNVRLGYLEFIDAENEPFMNQVAFASNASITKFSDLNMTFGLAIDNFDYLETQTPGPDTSTRLTADLSKPVLDFVTVGFFGSFDNQSQNTLYGLPSFEEVRADGQIIGGRLYLSISPWPWLAIGADSAIQQSTWTVTEPTGAQDTFERNQSDILQTNAGFIRLNLNF